MRELLRKLGQVSQEIASERGALTLFGLFEQEESLSKWDVVFSAPWVDQDEVEALRYVARKVQATLTPRELLDVSMVVPLKTTHPLAQAIQGMLHGLSDTHELGPFSVNGLDIVRAHIIATDQVRSPATRS
jgi:hypothetical protein